MIFKKLLPFFFTSFISCSQQPTRTNVFIVPQRHKPQVETKTNEPPLPPPVQAYYLTCNFIIDTSGEVFFYQQPQYSFYCGTGFTWDTPPKFINLKPIDIVQVPTNSLKDFINLNVLSLTVEQRRVAIASIKDTVQSIGLSKILAACNNSSNEIRWLFRKATEEENIVLQYKQHSWRYYPEDIKWDSTKIRFASEMNSSTPGT